MITTDFATFQTLVPSRCKVLYAANANTNPASLAVLNHERFTYSLWALTDNPNPTFDQVKAVYPSAVEVRSLD